MSTPTPAAGAPVRIRSIVRASAVLVLITIATIAGMIVALTTRDDPLSALPEILAATLLFHSASCLIGVSIVLIRERVGLRGIGVVIPGWRLLHLIWQIPLLIVAAVCVQIAVSVVLLNGRESPSGVASTSMLGATPSTIVTGVIAIAVLTPLWEELYFRGLLQTGVSGRWGRIPGIAVSSVLFCAVHGYVILIPYYLVLGLSLSWLRVFHGSLWGPLALHMALNTAASSTLLLSLR